MVLHTEELLLRERERTSTGGGSEEVFWIHI
jgi:hypothetical protein